MGVLLVLLGFCFFYFGSAKATPTERTLFLMDTVVTIRAIGSNSAFAVEEAFRAIKRVEALFSKFDEDSEVARINAGAGTWVSVSPEVFNLIALSKTYGELTDGAFDITIGPLMSLWGFSSRRYHVPSPEELLAVKEYVDYRKIALNTEHNQVKIPLGFRLDLGGVAKGYAVDKATEALHGAGIRQGLINAGGDITTLGNRPDGNPWRVGIQHPFELGAVLAVLPLTDQAVVTSGDYERFFEEQGVRFHHILNPKTGYPAENLVSVTVVAKEALMADILSTAFFVLGVDASLKVLESLSFVDAVFVDKEGEITVSEGLRRKIVYP